MLYFTGNYIGIHTKGKGSFKKLGRFLMVWCWLSCYFFWYSSCCLKLALTEVMRKYLCSFLVGKPKLTSLSPPELHNLYICQSVHSPPPPSLQNLSYFYPHSFSEGFFILVILHLWLPAGLVLLKMMGKHVCDGWKQNKSGWVSLSW